MNANLPFRAKISPMSNMPDVLTCSQCGAPLPVEQGRQFVTCQFCQAENFVDKRQAVLHYAVRDTLGAESATAALRRWMAGNDTIKGLDKSARITEVTFQLFPMWLVRTEQKGVETVVLEPGAALTVTELMELTIPASAMEPYDHTLDGQAIEPTVPLDTVYKWLGENHKIPPAAVQEVSLVHVPLFLAKYEHEGRGYTAVVDASNGRVFANIFPSKWEAPYQAIGILAFIAYFCAALIPYISYANSGEEGIILGLGAYAVACVVLAIPIFALAAYVSYKV